MVNTVNTVELISQTPKVSIIVLNFNGKLLLKDCLESLRKTIYPNFEVIVIDNASNDGSQRYVKQHFTWVKLIELNKNYGFCRANNYAAAIAKSDLLLFMNNDITVADSDWLTHMVNSIQSSPDVGAVGAKQLLTSRNDTIENIGGSFQKWQGGSRIGFGEKDLHQYDNLTIEPFYISGAALLIKRELFLRSGGFDPEMFAYCEDLDLCWRLRLQGYTIKNSPKSILFHKSSASFKNSLNSMYLSSRNLIRASFKNYSPLNTIKCIPFLLTTTIIFGLASTISTKKPFLLSISKSITYNIRNMASTVKARKAVQALRKSNDQVVFQHAQVGTIEGPSVIIKKIKNFS